MIKNRRKKRCSQRTGIQNTKDPSSGPSPENRRSQVVPLLEKSGVILTSGKRNEIDLQRVPDELKVKI